MTSLWLIIFEDWCKCNIPKVISKKFIKRKLIFVGILKATDEKSIIRVRSRKSVGRIRGSGYVKMSRIPQQCSAKTYRKGILRDEMCSACLWYARFFAPTTGSSSVFTVKFSCKNNPPWSTTGTFQVMGTFSQFQRWVSAKKKPEKENKSQVRKVSFYKCTGGKPQPSKSMANHLIGRMFPPQYPFQVTIQLRTVGT